METEALHTQKRAWKRNFMTRFLRQDVLYHTKKSGSRAHIFSGNVASQPAASGPAAEQMPRRKPPRVRGGKLGLPLVAQPLPVTPQGSCFHGAPVRKAQRHMSLLSTGTCGDGLSRPQLLATPEGGFGEFSVAQVCPPALLFSEPPPLSTPGLELSESLHVIINLAWGGAMASHSPPSSYSNVPVSPKMFPKKNKLYLRNTEKPAKNVKSLS